MSQNKRLRELLEEARLWVAASESFILMRNGVGWSEQLKLLEKIDDILLEPPEKSIPILPTDEEADKLMADYEKTLESKKITKQVLWSKKDDK